MSQIEKTVRKRVHEEVELIFPLPPKKQTSPYSDSNPEQYRFKFTVERNENGCALRVVLPKQDSYPADVLCAVADYLNGKIE